MNSIKEHVLRDARVIPTLWITTLNLAIINIMKIVDDLMTRDLFPLKSDQTLNVVRLLMRTVHIRRVPILNRQGKFVGLLSHRDLLAYSISKLHNHNRLQLIDT